MIKSFYDKLTPECQKPFSLVDPAAKEITKTETPNKLINIKFYQFAGEQHPARREKMIDKKSKMTSRKIDPVKFSKIAVHT